MINLAFTKVTLKMSETNLIQVGDVIDVVVMKIEDRGIYVSYKEITGFIDVIHLSWVLFRAQCHRFYRVGEKLRVQVLFIQPCEFYFFGASLKTLMPLSNPWLYPELFAVGAKLEVSVKAVLDFGCFVILGFGIEAHLPRKNMTKELKVGDLIAIKITSVELGSSTGKILVEMI